MKTKEKLLEIIKNQLAIEYNCSIDDFSLSNNIITRKVNHPNVRHYINGTFFFQMVTFGTNAVITSNEKIHKSLEKYVKDQQGHWLFEHNNLQEIEKILIKNNKKLSPTHHMFLSFKKIIPKDNGLKIKWFEQEMIHKFYENKLFPNALCKEFNPKRPDVLAIAVYDKNKIIGMAGCSADTPLLWQIGIDINEKYNGKGIGTYLVTLLKNEIEKRDKIPFYGTSLSNIKSWQVALNSRFSPVWV